MRIKERSLLLLLLSTSAVNTALVIAHAQQKLLFDVSNNG